MSLNKTGIFTAFVLKHDEIRHIIALDLFDRGPFFNGKLAHFAVHIVIHVEERDDLKSFDDLAMGLPVFPITLPSN